MFYIVTRRDHGWRIQLRTGAASPAGLEASERAEIVADARQAVLDFFTAFNAGDADATVETLNHPHLFITPPGRFVVDETPDGGPRQNFDQMRQREGWHMSSIDSLEASIVTRNKVQFELVFSRWHPNGTRYWTVPALWIVTRAGGHWESRCARSYQRLSIQEAANSSPWTSTTGCPHERQFAPCSSRNARSRSRKPGVACAVRWFAPASSTTSRFAMTSFIARTSRTSAS